MFIPVWLLILVAFGVVLEFYALEHNLKKAIENSRDDIIAQMPVSEWQKHIRQHPEDRYPGDDES